MGTMRIQPSIPFYPEVCSMCALAVARLSENCGGRFWSHSGVSGGILVFDRSGALTVGQKSEVLAMCARWHCRSW